jgi:hypothetical protein
LKSSRASATDCTSKWLLHPISTMRNQHQFSPVHKLEEHSKALSCDASNDCFILIWFFPVPFD